MYNIFMYIVELIAKILKEKKEKKGSHPIPQGEEQTLEEKCEHTFFPIDSTGKTLACSKCGLVAKNDSQKVKPKNPFN